MNKYLIVKGCAGLGNRLITLSNAIEYSKKTGRILFVDWSDGIYGAKGENVFYKYFDIKEIDYLTTYKEIEYSSIYPKIWKHIGINASLYDYYSFGNPKLRLNKRLLPAKGKLNNINGYFHFRGSKYKKYEYIDIWLYLKSLLSNRDMCFGSNLKLSLNEDVVIFSDFTPKLYAQNLMNHLVLKDDIKLLIDTFVHKNNLKHSTGVHIRNTDRKSDNAINNIFDKISKLGLENTSIFLATDDNTIIDTFKSKYDNVIVYTKFIPNVELSGGGIHHWASSNKKNDYAEQVFWESIIDLWLLSKCNYLLYMGNSSFSRIAVALHNSKCIDWLSK